VNAKQRTEPVAESAQAFAQSLPETYRKRFGPAEIAAHAHISLAREPGIARAGIFPWAEEGVAAVCVSVEDRPGLLALISGALTECGFEVESAEAYCRVGEPSVAVDFFWLREPSSVIGPEDIEAFAELLNEILRGERSPQGPPLGLSPPSSLGTTVRFLEQSDGTLTVLEVETADRSGLLWALTRALHGEDVQISGSQIRTQGDRVLDRFTIVELDGSPITPERRLRIQVAVLSALEPTPGDSSAT
jgi:[protein-PII] uridylyltransferase